MHPIRKQVAIVVADEFAAIPTTPGFCACGVVVAVARQRQSPSDLPRDMRAQRRARFG